VRLSLRLFVDAFNIAFASVCAVANSLVAAKKIARQAVTIFYSCTFVTLQT
jgi:hypothetical protein